MVTKTSSKRAGNMVSLVYEQIRADILSGKLAAGTPLSQLELAQNAGTSRGPVREALRRLQQDRLVIARENQRYSVAPFDLAELEGILSLHLANITLAIEVSVPRLCDAEIHHLANCASAMASAAQNSDQIAWEKFYRDFILSIVTYAGQKICIFVGELIDSLQRYRETHMPAPFIYVGGDPFGQILNAAAARDGKLAASLYAKFASRTSSLILASVAPQYEPSRLRAYIVALDAYDER